MKKKQKQIDFRIKSWEELRDCPYVNVSGSRMTDHDTGSFIGVFIDFSENVFNFSHSSTTFTMNYDWDFNTLEELLEYLKRHKIGDGINFHIHDKVEYA